MDLQQSLATAAARMGDQVERIQAQLEFAEVLCTLHPAQADTWRALMETARNEVIAALSGGQAAAIQDSVRRAEDVLTPLASTAQEYTIHCIGHAHIDMNWMWSWPETVAVTVDTFRTVLHLLDAYPDFCFSQSQASTYKIIQDHRPEMLEQIAAHVRSGRWEVTASHWVEGDKNLASAESLCRHVLYARAYMQELFGLQPEDVPLDWAPDTFGHARSVPTYLVRGGIRYVYMHRPGASGPRRPWLFWWQAPDGSRVLVRNDSAAGMGYNGQITPAALLRDWTPFTRETGLKDHMFVFGVGDHGGGPTRRDLERIAELDRWPVFPRLRCGRARDYMDRVAAVGDSLPVLDCELNFEFTGCYTTQTLVKRANRLGESRLVDAEIAAALSCAGGQGEYPHAAFTEAWRDVLFSHFHDILPGSGVRDTRTYTHGLFQKTMAVTAQVETGALRALAARVDTSTASGETAMASPPSLSPNSLGAGVGFHTAEGGLAAADQSAGSGPRPFLLFNPTAVGRDEIIQVTIWSTRDDGTPLRQRSFAVETDAGEQVPAQVVGGGHYWGHDFAELVFPVSVSGLGYSTCTVLEAAAAAEVGVWQLGREHPCPYSSREREQEGLENEAITLRIDPRTGGICSLVDRASGLDLLDGSTGTAPLEMVTERPHGMSAWLIGYPDGPARYPTVRALRRTRKGPYEAAIEVDLAIDESEFTLTYTLRAGEPRVHLSWRGTWFQRGTQETGVPALRLCLPLALEACRGTYEIPLGAIQRSEHEGEEVPALRWAQVDGTQQGRPAGCLLANDCKYGHSLQDNVLRVTLIRSSYEPDALPEIGAHEACFAIRPYVGTLSTVAAIHEGERLNHPLRVVSTDVHAGTLPARAQFLRVGPDPVIMTAIKYAEGETALIVRLYNPTATAVTAHVEPAAALLGVVAAVTEVDLMERRRDGSTARQEGNRIQVDLPPWGLTSLRVDFAAQA